MNAESVWQSQAAELKLTALGPCQGFLLAEQYEAEGEETRLCAGIGVSQ